tara:strand:+ start:3533 stop:4333 length:801 start_codon:yes stop_codon:yes gene_type:complete
MIKSLIRKLLDRMGYVINKKNDEEKYWDKSRSMRGALSNLAKLGINPKCVFDVGVGHGTNDLYESFPNAFQLLVEPLDEFEGTIEKILAKYDGAWEKAAGMDQDGVMQMNVHPAHLEGSSFFNESIGSFADGEQRVVTTKLLDTIAKERKLKGPYMIKIDAQGAEKKIILGAMEVLQDTDAVILEVSMFNFLVDCQIFHEIVNFMYNLGFLVYDIFGLSYRPFDDALAQVDLVFVKENSVLREKHIFSSIEEFKKTYANINPLKDQ